MSKCFCVAFLKTDETYVTCLIVTHLYARVETRDSIYKFITNFKISNLDSALRTHRMSKMVLEMTI